MLRDCDYVHLPVLFDECMNALQIKSDGIYVDCTAGGGGHSVGILSRLGKGGTLISLDKDENAIITCKNQASSLESAARWKIIQSDYSKIDCVLDELGILKIDGVLADLGVSSHQIDTSERGFSYSNDGPLDMRMDASQFLTAQKVVNEYEEEKIEKILREYGEERFARRIAGAIVHVRRSETILTTKRLKEIVISAMPAKSRKEDQHPARRTFQAIRIEVNGELEAIKKLLENVPARLNDKGRFAVISFHSLEDRLVKETFKKLVMPCTCPREFPVCICEKIPMGKSITSKPIEAGMEEIKTNKRAKSAKLRVFERNQEEWKPLH